MEFDNEVRHRVGSLFAHPRPRSGARVIGTACIPGARAYLVTWTLDSSRDQSARVSVQQSIGGADYGLRNLDLSDNEASESTWVTGGGYGQIQLVTQSACVVAEVYGHNRGTADAIIQLHDAAFITPGDFAQDEWFVPAGGTFHRSLPPRIFTHRLIVARSTTVNTFTPEITGTQLSRARILVR